MNLFGNVAEEYACKYLRSKNYTIIRRNYSSKYGEIDIIALKNNEIVCIEVKASNGWNYELPGLRVGRRKLMRIISTFYVFLNEHTEYVHMSYRSDVISVVALGSNKSPHLIHHKNVQFNDVYG